MRGLREVRPMVRRFGFASMLLAGATASAVALADSDKARNPVNERRPRASLTGSASARQRHPGQAPCLRPS